MNSDELTDEEIEQQAYADFIDYLPTRGWEEANIHDDDCWVACPHFPNLHDS